ncbi:MAG TPA: membrane protein insertase YidC [Candidatus Methylomirabilis sp.]|nr:membrane protein insertase YidC [Candidatus Methylomirabilis sp.]
MDNQRLLLFFALALVLMFIWQAWEQQNAPPPVSTTPAPSAPSNSTPSVPAVPEQAGAEQTKTPKMTAVLPRETRIHVRTDLVEAVIDTEGGDVRQWDLRRYPVSVDKPDEPFLLMQDKGPEFFITQSGVIGLDGQYPTHKVRFTAEKNRYDLAEGKDELRVPLTWLAANGVQYTKTYVFHRGSYVVDVEFTVKNASNHEWSGYFYGQFQRTHALAKRGFFGATPSYTGGAIYTPDNKFEKIPFDKMTEQTLKADVAGGWVAMLEQYFVSSWLLPQDQHNEFFSRTLEDGHHVLGFKNLNPTKVAPGQTGILKESFYAGPTEHKILKTLPDGMNLTVDYGWLTFISAPLFWLLAAIHSLLGNWGWAIIVLTILIKAAFYPLSATSYKSMAQMRKLQPKMQALKERYGDDRQKLNQAMMELYKTEKINPLGGCLPILVQIPVFLALYWVLLESVEMRQAPWILWIRDLSAQDPYYVLPLIMGVSMFAQQKLNPQPVDPVQQKVFMVMPVVFTAMFLFFPAGLVLYWTVNNILSIAQQWRITRVIEGKK